MELFEKLIGGHDYRLVKSTKISSEWPLTPLRDISSSSNPVSTFQVVLCDSWFFSCCFMLVTKAQPSQTPLLKQDSQRSNLPVVYQLTRHSCLTIITQAMGLLLASNSSDRHDQVVCLLLSLPVAVGTEKCMSRPSSRIGVRSRVWWSAYGVRSEFSVQSSSVG